MRKLYIGQFQHIAVYYLACMQAHGWEGIVGLQGRHHLSENTPFYNTPHSQFNCQKRTNYRNPKTKQHASKCCWFALLIRNENIAGLARKCPFIFVFGTGKYGQFDRKPAFQFSVAEEIVGTFA